MNSRFATPEDSPGFLLWKLTVQWQKQQRQALSPLDLTHPQFVYLACLKWLMNSSSSPVTQSQISNTSKMDKMVISETTKKLLNKKLILRKSNNLDARSYTISLSKKGEMIVEQALPLVENVDKDFFQKYKDEIDHLNSIITCF